MLHWSLKPVVSTAMKSIAMWSTAKLTAIVITTITIIKRKKERLKAVPFAIWFYMLMRPITLATELIRIIMRTIGAMNLMDTL